MNYGYLEAYLLFYIQACQCSLLLAGPIIWHLMIANRLVGSNPVGYETIYNDIKVSMGAKIKNQYNQVPHLTQDTNGKVTNSQQTPQTRAKRSALSQQVTTKHK